MKPKHGMTKFIIDSATNIQCAFCKCFFEEGYDIEYDSSNGNFYCNYECLERHDKQNQGGTMNKTIWILKHYGKVYAFETFKAAEAKSRILSCFTANFGSIEKLEVESQSL